jgi:cardiolipin synthase
VKVLTVPNVLTMSRAALAPLFLVLYVRRDTGAALAVFAVAAATDVLDGLAARILDQRSLLGAWLDPLADKLLEACALVALASRGELPWWLPLLVLSRDVAQFAGAAWLRSTRHAVPMAPTRFGKYATFTLAATVVLALGGHIREDLLGRVGPYVAATGLIAAQCVVVSWLQYFLYFVRSLREPRIAS